MDFEEEIPQNESELWQKLIILKDSTSSHPLDPTDVKRCLILTEKRRCESSNILPENQNFSVGTLSLRSLKNMKIGQQDAKEFFMCLDENQQQWTDVFNIFKLGVLSETECSHCGNVSRQENCYNLTSYIRLDCPQEDTTLRAYFEMKMNGFELRQNWRDENGCNKVTTGRYRSKIADIRDTKYLVFVVERLMKIDNQLLIRDTKIKAEVNECISIEDSKGRNAIFTLLCITHHTGRIIDSSDTHGHYCADVKNFNNSKWYRTSDSNQPLDVTNSGLTNNGYIFLFKKIAIDRVDIQSTSSTNELKRFVLSQFK